jgi:hypothetical protein
MSAKTPHESSPVEIRRSIQKLHYDYDTNFWTQAAVPTVAGQVFISSGASSAAWGLVSTGLQVDGGELKTKDSEIDHDVLANFVANEHINHTSVSISAGTGLSGGGDISANRSIALSHLGIEALSSPGGDRILFWDHSGTACGWLSIGSGLSISDTTISVSAGGVDHGGLAGLGDDDHTQYLLADGTRNLTGNMAVDALVTIDGRDLSVDGAKLDGVEAGADVTDATNVAAAGAAMDGGAHHDGFSDFVANEHIDWTNASDDLVTSGYVRGGQIGVGAAPLTGRAIYVSHSVTDSNNYHGIQVLYTNTTTSTGTYNARALTFVCTPDVNSGQTNNGSVVGVWCQSLADGGLAGTLYNQVGVLANVGAYTGMTGTIQNCAAGRFTLYHRAGTVTAGYILHLMEDGAGTLTTGYAIYDTSSLDWVLEDDNKKIRLGATQGDFDLYSDGTDATIDASGDLYLNPTGNVKFGSHSAIGAETVTGYITIKDAAGNTRKLAVVS